jgi:hypothetical protein
MLLGCLSTLLIWLVCSIHFRVRRHPEKFSQKYRLPIEAIAGVARGVDWTSQWRKRLDMPSPSQNAKVS